MTPAILALAAGVGLCFVGAYIRRRRAGVMGRTFVAFAVHMPGDVSSEEIALWLGMVAANHQLPRGAFRPATPLFLEVRATERGIRHYILIPRSAQSQLLSSIRAGLPGARVEAAPPGVFDRHRFRAAVEMRLTTTRQPLAVERGTAVTAALLASLQPLRHGEAICLSWSLCGASSSARTPALGPRSFLTEFWPELAKPRDSEAVRAWHHKQSEPLLWATLRIGADAASPRRARALLASTTATFRSMNAPDVLLRPSSAPDRLIAKRMAAHTWPLTRWPLLLNTNELSGLIGVPYHGLVLPGLAAHTARQLPPPTTPVRSGLMLGRSNYPGTNLSLVIGTEDRLRHLHLIGPTGVGKSTLIANLALQDIAAGRGIAVIDPKNDLVDDILARIPDSRRDDVVVLDPSAVDQQIIGFNLLGGLRNEADRELVVDHVLHIMSSLWADSWGPRTSDVLRSALLTLTHTRAPDGSAFTMAEVAPLLTEPGFRRFVTGLSTVPDAVRPFWQFYEQQSQAQQVQIIGPSLNKLRALTTRTPLRLMLGQSRGIEAGDLLRPGRTLLVKLSKGTVGTDTAQLLGALLVASLWHATLKRAAIPAVQRRPYFIYADEFQDILRLPLDMGDMLAQARGLGVGLVLAHQHFGQLPESIKRAVLGTVRSSVVFQLDYDDAQLVARRMEPLSVSDLTGLSAYEVALRLCVHGHTGSPVTGVTLPLAGVTTDAVQLAEYSRAHFGMPRTDVEDGLRARITLPTKPTNSGQQSFGRRKRGSNG